MDRLPTELLSKIFAECLPDFDDSHPPVSTSFVPMLFTIVNQRWRQVSCNLPELWTRISISIDVTADLLHGAEPTAKWERLQSKGEVIVRWFERSAGCDVSVSFRIVNVGLRDVPFGLRNKMFEELMLPMVDSIRTFSKQWRHLDLRALYDPYLSSILSIPVENLPRLTQLSFSGDTTAHPSSFNSFFTFKESGVIRAPLLSSLRLMALDQLQDLPLADWANLRELRFSSNIADAEALLRRCKNLNVLELAVREGGPPLAHPSQDIVLPYLTSFSLAERAGDPQGRPFLTPFVFLLKLPSLTHLEAVAGVQPEFDQEAFLMTLIKANESTFRSTLTNIEFDYNYVNPEELEECFKLLPAVRHMTMNAGLIYPYCDMDDRPGRFAMLWGLTDLLPSPVDSENANGVVECKLPNLECFNVTLQRECEFEADDLVEFVERRLKYAGLRNNVTGEPIAKLESVYVGFMSEKKIDVREELGKRGVDLDEIEIDVSYELECQYADT